jgi:PAS domain S-box-containing protein
LNKSTFLIAGTAVLALLVTAISLLAFNQLTDANAARARTYELIDRSNAFLSELKDGETAERGYLLTGDDIFLEPYTAMREGIAGHMNELRQLASSNGASERLAALTPLVDAKLAEMAHLIELRRDRDLKEVTLAMTRGLGKRQMDLIRAQMSEFLQAEERVLAQREAGFQSDMRRLFAVIVATSLLTLLSALLFAYLLYRETRQRAMNLAHLETRRLLDIQEETNKQLQQAYATLQDSEEKLDVTLNSIGDAVIATDGDALVTRLNPVAERLTGWTQQEALGRPVEAIFHIVNQETRQPSAIPIKETLALGTIHGLANHTVLIGRDGRECAIADSCAPILNRDGRVVGAVLVFRNVTEEYAVQQALRDHSALIQTILNTVVDSIITLHASDGIIERVNLAAEWMFGYAANELVGRNICLLIPELDDERRTGSRTGSRRTTPEWRGLSAGNCRQRDVAGRQMLLHGHRTRSLPPKAARRGIAARGSAAKGHLQQRQLFQHRHGCQGRHTDFQRRRRAHAGLRRRRCHEQDYPRRHFRSARSDRARQVLE